MSSENSEQPHSTATLIGHTVGVALVTATTLLASSGVFAFAWRNGAARLLRLPDLSWAESLACLICLWILLAPLRVVRVRMTE